MIAVDTSVLVAILMVERDATDLLTMVTGSDAAVIAAPSVLEAAMVLNGRLTPDPTRQLDELLSLEPFKVVAFTPDDAEIARGAFLRFGKGTGHPAQLNYGDCMSYAIAKARGLPLLFKGDDFRRTDIVAAL